MPSFVSRVERPDRGGEWVATSSGRARADRELGARLGLTDAGAAATRAVGRLLHVDGDEEDLLAALLFESAGGAEDAIRAASARSTEPSGRRCSPTLVGERANRRHRPAAASRRCATASRSSPTTAPSATCSATGC